jgi:adenylate cyclase class 2
MNPTQQELEVKFWLADLPAVELRLLELEAQLAHARVLEINLRFDTPEGLLTNRSQVLRLRQDFGVHLTFKGPSRPGEAVSIRKEIEFEASSFLAARDFLEALGYQVMVMYEKYRTEYQFKDVLVMLDEMPYGNFCEIEGADVASIQAAAAELGLNWGARNLESYLGIFGRLQQAGLEAYHLSFSEFAGKTVHLEDLGLSPADRV